MFELCASPSDAPVEVSDADAEAVLEPEGEGYWLDAEPDSTGALELELELEADEPVGEGYIFEDGVDVPSTEPVAEDKSDLELEADTVDEVELSPG